MNYKETIKFLYNNLAVYYINGKRAYNLARNGKKFIFFCSDIGGIGMVNSLTIEALKPLIIPP